MITTTDNTEPLILLNNLIDENLLKAEITDIYWDRILLNINVKINVSSKLNSNQPLDFYLVNSYYCARAKFESKKINDENIELVLNFTNPGYNLCLPAQKYGIYAVQGNNILSKLSVSNDLAPVLSSKSGFFSHNKSGVYCFEFSLEETDNGFFPQIRTMDTKKINIRDIGKNPASQLKRKKRFSKIKKYIKGKRKFFVKKYYNWINKFRKRNKKKERILFLTEQSKELGKNLECVYNRIFERGLDSNYDIEISCRAIISNKEEYKFKSWIKTITAIAKADKIFIDDHVPLLDWLELNKKTEVLQLWHAGAGYKSSGYSRWGHTGGPAPFSCHRQYTYGICESKNVGAFHAEVFGINLEKMLPTGMPRMDEYINEEYKIKKTKELLELFPLIKNKKIILFAPTYRGVNKKTAHYPFEMIDFDKMYDICQDEYVVLFKLHPWIETPVPFPAEYEDKFIDITSYKNINDIFYITDLLITDYSSNVFEYSIMRKPVLFYAFDEYQYSFTRGFHRDYEKSTPGKICYTFQELIDSIVNKDFEFEKMEAYISFHFDHIDCNSTDRVIDWLLLGNIPDQYLQEIENKNKTIEYMKRLYFIALQNRE
ncbi:MAG: CDP-glycerol glycerophosphotransferase family protein [Clostridiales bacterium]|nr:CDP-glycerol glycerophosphotransferase family protein [Clostridiales bacterium]MBS5877816.1 CDP-glycerol glycerophosphotransferase family protein [Clostridiales bacterium]MDU0940058.1 CDP-glycerol glycerophosphotransferase family protein [Clostridiales bacterium]MDU1041715.1 CDP-glycerol glycerophosphotransferase family protein [Clostridiales bacterium]MDU3489915.1 CDP-glycerol glycerophosphotransferase family protein [Clostridiales bacterium]